MSRFVILCHCLVWAFALPAGTSYGARAPQAIKRTFVLRGDAAVSLGALFGLGGERSSCLLRLGEDESGAAYFLDKHAEEPPDGWDNVEVYNLLEFSTDAGPRLSISPYWLDLRTQAPVPESGYSFGSQRLPLDLSNDDLWTRLVKRLRASGELKAPASPETIELLSSRIFRSSDGTKIRLEIYRFSEIYRSIITAWPNSQG